jgi:hypothetical protein
MKVVCPNCGQEVIVSGLGRKGLNMPVTIICDELRRHKGEDKAPNKAAETLGCSRAYLYKVLKAEDLKMKDIIKK